MYTGSSDLRFYANGSGVIPSIQSLNEIGYSGSRISYANQNSFASAQYVDRQISLSTKELMTFLNTTVPTQSANYTTGWSTVLNNTPTGRISMSSGTFTLQPGYYEIQMKGYWTASAGSEAAFSI